DRRSHRHHPTADFVCHGCYCGDRREASRDHPTLVRRRPSVTRLCPPWLAHSCGGSHGCGHPDTFGGPGPWALVPPRLAPGNQHALPVKGARHGSTEPWRCCSAKVVRRHLPLRLIEMPQVGWRLARSARPQLAVNLDVVGLPLDENIVVVLGTAVLDPNRVTRAAIAAGDCPGAGARGAHRRCLSS